MTNQITGEIVAVDSQGNLVAVIGPNDQLELAIVNDSAKIMLGVGVGMSVEVVW